MSRNETEQIMEKLQAIEKMVLDNNIKTDEMYDFYLDGKIGVKLLKWGFALAMSIGGAYLMFKNIIK